MKPNTVSTKILREAKSYLWQLACVFQPNRVVSFKLPDNLRFVYPLKSAIGLAIFSGGFEMAETQFWIDSLRPGQTVFDVGANGGLYSILAAHKVGVKGHVYAFEPGVKELELLRNNIEVNNLTNITVIECAVCDSCGETQFAVATDGAMNSLAKNDHPSQKIVNWRTVQTITLDEVMSRYNLNKVDLMKIDVEGAEPLVFKGAKNLIEKSDKLTVLFEASDLTAAGFNYTVKSFLEDVAKKGFIIKYFSRDGHIKDHKTSDEGGFGKSLYNFIAQK